jgi:hypothetical protein
MLRKFIGLAFAAAAAGASAQLATPDPDWKEAEAPAPPAVTTNRLIELEVPGSSLRFGVDPGSVSVGPDGIVRYVVVATSTTGTVNAVYEGVRCSTAEVKVYARHNPDSGWVPARSDWQPLHQIRNSRYSLLVARNGACVGHAPNGNAAQVVRDLRAPVDRRFWQQ